MSKFDNNIQLDTLAVARSARALIVIYINISIYYLSSARKTNARYESLHGLHTVNC